MNHDNCKFESKIIQMAEDIATIKGTTERLDIRINGSIDDIEKHIDNGHKWRLTIATVGITVILNIIIFSYVFGQINKQVEVNTKRLFSLEDRILK